MPTWKVELISEAHADFNGPDGMAMVLDPGWKTYGMSAEIIAAIHENNFSTLKKPVKRITLPDIPAPASKTLENAYYPCTADIITGIEEMVR